MRAALGIPGTDPVSFPAVVTAGLGEPGGGPAAPAAGRFPEEKDGGESLLILVVDDEEDVRTLLSAHLEAAGYEVRCAADGVEALQVLSNCRPHAVLLDVMMPGPDGFAVLKAMRALPSHALTPVIIETAVNLDAEEERWFRDRGALVLRKHRLFGEELMNALKRLREPDLS